MSANMNLKEIQSQLTGAGSPFELSKKVIKGSEYLVYKNAPLTLAEVINNARRTDDQNFLVYQEQRLSFKKFFEQMDCTVSWMLDKGITKGDKIVIAMRNRPEWVVAFCAIASIGAIPAPLNSFGLSDELNECINNIEPKLIICDASRWERINEPKATQVISLVLNDLCIDLHDAQQAFDFNEATNFPPFDYQIPKIEETDPALILFTSGATSTAKPVVSSHIAICQALFNIDFISAMSAMTSPEKLKNIMSKQLVPTLLTSVPLFHVSGLHAQLLTALRGGRRMVFTHKWTADEAIKLIKTEKVTQFNGAPSMIMQLVRHPEFTTPEVLDSLCGLGFGGSGIAASCSENVLSVLDKQLVGIGFGMTESNGVCAAISGDLFNYKPTSSGLISPIMNVRICSSEGETLGINEEGEVNLSGICIMDGYLNHDDSTAKVFNEGWLRTGDVGYIDEEGFLFIVDRIKDVIIRSGENISSVEVESCLMAHEKVEEAAVFSVPDDETGEAVIAAIKTFNGVSVSEDELKAHVKERLANYKTPSTIHISQNHLPRNPAGKLLRRKVKDMFYS